MTVTLEFISRQMARGFDELRQDMRMLRAAINNVAKENVTPGEISAIHHDLNRLMGQVSELAARVDLLEQRP